MLAMSTFVSPQIFLVLLLAGWLNQEQQKILEYLQEENRVLKVQLGQRLGLSDEQRRRLSAKGKELGRKLLAEVATLVTPDTILRWHRELIARKGRTLVVKRGVRPSRWKSRSWSCAWPSRARLGATTESKELWPTSATRSRRTR